MKKENVYIVTAYRWGGRESHSYVVGVYGKKHAAIQAAESEKSYRGGKYECQVQESPISKKWSEDRCDSLKIVYGHDI